MGNRVIDAFPPCDVRQENEVQEPAGANYHDPYIPEAIAKAMTDIKSGER